VQRFGETARVLTFVSGHNYYNRRDQERTFRRMQWLDKVMGGQDDWEEQYKMYIAKQQKT
jgi:hypothetical protein